MRIKEGDWFISLKNMDKGTRSIGSIHKVTKVNRYQVFYVGLNGEETHTRVNGSIEKLPNNNSLNKKLYPTYIEHEGFLLPEKTVAKIKAEE